MTALVIMHDKQTAWRETTEQTCKYRRQWHGVKPQTWRGGINRSYHRLISYFTINASLALSIFIIISHRLSLARTIIVMSLASSAGGAASASSARRLIKIAACRRLALDSAVTRAHKRGAASRIRHRVSLGWRQAAAHKRHRNNERSSVDLLGIAPASCRNRRGIKLSSSYKQLSRHTGVTIAHLAHRSSASLFSRHRVCCARVSASSALAHRLFTHHISRSRHRASPSRVTRSSRSSSLLRSLMAASSSLIIATHRSPRSLTSRLGSLFAAAYQSSA